eukprot:6299813-Prymnesium_polylepis.1
MVGRKNNEVSHRRCAVKLAVHGDAAGRDRRVERASPHIVHTHCVGVAWRKDDDISDGCRANELTAH